MSQQLLIGYENKQVDSRMLKENPEEALRILIAQQSNGQINNNLLHSVIMLIMSSNDNKLKRMLYYFFETLNEHTKDLLVCLNQVKKDLLSPNEFVRGFALQFTSKIQNQEYAALFLSEVKENLKSVISSVRLNALFCLGELGRRFDFDVESIIIQTLLRESSPHVLCVGFESMDKLGMSFDKFLQNEYPHDVLVCLIEKVDETVFLQNMVKSRYIDVSFYAACKLLRKSVDGEACMDNILRILELHPDYKQDFQPCLRYVSSHALGLLGLIDPYDFEFSEQAIDTVFKIADTIDFIKVAEFLYERFKGCTAGSDKKKAFKLMLLDKMAVFSASHCIFVENLVFDCFKCIQADDPDMMLSCLNFLHTCIVRESLRPQIHDFLIANFSKIKYGKLIRKIFDILSEGISKQRFNDLIDKILEDLAMDNESAPYYLTQAPEVFVGAYICINFARSYDFSWNLKSKVLGAMLKMLEVATARNIIDMSSRMTINTCIRSILSEVKHSAVTEKHSYAFTPTSVLKPVEFGLLKPTTILKKFMWNDSLSAEQTTVQLTGLGDPLYIEADCVHSKYEITLDLLVINQTTAYLQDMQFDFNYSKNIQMITSLDTFSLQPNSAITITVQFSIKETLASFVTATVTFKYPRKDDYSGKPFVQNLSEIVFDVNRFLEPANVDFKSEWPKLEWENIYSLSIRKQSSDLLEKIQTLLKGHLCDRLEHGEFTVANFGCFTLQKTLILVNMCTYQQGTGSFVEIKVRSKNHDLVKAVSALLANFLKAIQ